MVTQVSSGFDSRVNLSWIQTASVARQSVGKSSANLSSWSPCVISRMLSQRQATKKYSNGVSEDPPGPEEAKMLGKLPGETQGARVCCLTCQAGLRVRQLWAMCVSVCLLECVNTAGCSRRNSQSGCHSIPPQTLSSSSCCGFLLLLLTIGCQTFRNMCPLAATATQFIQHASNPEADLACSLICTKPRTYRSQ